jgi:hypothetical protein
MTGKREIRRKQLSGDLNKTKGYRKIERKSINSPSVEKLTLEENLGLS